MRHIGSSLNALDEDFVANRTSNFQCDDTPFERYASAFLDLGQASSADSYGLGSSNKDLVEEAATRFEECEKLLRGAIAAGDAAQACTWVQHAFGTRFPARPDRVKVVSVAATIAATPAVPDPSELVGRTRAG